MQFEDFLASPRVTQASGYARWGGGGGVRDVQSCVGIDRRVEERRCVWLLCELWPLIAFWTASSAKVIGYSLCDFWI